MNEWILTLHNRTSGQRTLAAYKKAAADVDSAVSPKSTAGGEVGPAATGAAATSSGSSESTATEDSASGTASATESSEPNAGLEARGEIRWGLLSMGVAMAGFFGGLMM